jgi:hypothetical protein
LFLFMQRPLYTGLKKTKKNHEKVVGATVIIKIII